MSWHLIWLSSFCISDFLLPILSFHTTIFFFIYFQSLFHFFFYLVVVWAYRTNHVRKVSFRVKEFQERAVEFQDRAYIMRDRKIYTVFCWTVAKEYPEHLEKSCLLVCPWTRSKSLFGWSSHAGKNLSRFLFICYGTSVTNVSSLGRGMLECLILTGDLISEMIELPPLSLSPLPP